ncbi:heavy metal translocating P-type ATPase [Desulfovibrio sp. OttesenSCG-928-M16]|nr:heavy metal translocating P-type ATPase [Desulfovibrio sp. OttesenSCG-928-M16]
MTSATTLCPCGLQHPIGFVCEKATELIKLSLHEEPCGDCCAHNHAPAAPLDLALTGEASDTRAIYRIMNMDCPMEEALIRKKLASVPGITNLDFNLMQRVLTVDHELPSTEPIVAALKAIDMTPEPLGLDQAGASNVIPEAKIPWVKLAFAGVFAALSEAIELINEWGATPFGLDIGAWQMNGILIAEWLPLAFAVLAILFGGLTTYRKGWLAISNFNLNINALMSVAVTGAVIIGQYPEAAMVMVLFNLSEAIEAKALDRARNAIKNLLALAPEKATVLRSDGAWIEMDIRQVAVGSRVRVKPGEKVALDGVILSGQSALNQAPITGESMPVEKAAGDTVYAGTINESGSFEFEVTAASTESTLARIIHAVEEAQGSRAPMQRFVDQFSRYYTPAVFLIAILVAVIPPLFMGGVWTEAIYTGLVILVIGCPCALVISTPVSIVSGMAAATRYGILIKGGMFLEQGRLLNWIALDKTGTITHGKPRQTDFAELGDMGDYRTRAIASSIAARSDHPVSKAIAENARENGIELLDVDDFTAIPGQGVSGVIDGQTWYLGNHRMVEDLKKCSAKLEKQILALEKMGKTVVALVGNKGVEGLFAVADTLKDSSIEAIRELKKLGVKTMMLTGDNEHTASAVAKQVGVDGFKGNLLPEDKLRVVEELEAAGNKVGMVGDGINDAPALARANIGFAMAGGGTDTAIETADVALMDDDLRKIPRFIGLSRSTYAILVQNITLALVVKAIFFALTFMGMATMWMAVFADVGTALIVVANGLRAIRQ